MDYQWHLIWHSQYGTEEVDSFDTRTEAEAKVRRLKPHASKV